MAHSYRGELVFVDHANRRGSIRVESTGIFRFSAPRPFAMLPYGIVRYHGAPADLRDIPLGTMLHVRAFLPPDPKTSSVPVLPVNNREKGELREAPARHLPRTTILLEDEPSHCLSARAWSGSSKKWRSRTTRGRSSRAVNRSKARTAKPAKKH